MTYVKSVIPGLLLGALICMDPYVVNPLAHVFSIEVGGKSILKLYPYELSSLVLLVIALSFFLRKGALWMLGQTERAFVLLFLLGIQVKALTEIGRIDLSELVLIVFVLILLSKSFIEDQPIKVTLLLILNILFVGSLFMSSVNGGFGSIPDYMIVGTKFLLIVFLVATFVRRREFFSFSLKCIVVLTTLSAIAAILQEVLYLWTGGVYVGMVSKKELDLMFEETSFGTFLRVPAFFGGYKAFSLVLNAAILIVFNYLLCVRPRHLRMWWGGVGASLIMLAAVIFTFSTDAYLALGLGILLSVGMRWKHLLIHGIACALLLGVLAATFGLVDTLARVVSTELSWGEQRIRVQLNREGLEGFRDRHPWIGTGIRETDRYTGDVHRWPAHNAFIEGADGAGILGLSLYVALLGYTCLSIMKVNLLARAAEDQWMARSLLSAFVALMVAFQFHPFFLEKTLWLLMALAEAYLLIVLHQEKQSSGQNSSMAALSTG